MNHNKFNKLRKTATSPMFLVALAIAIGMTAVGTLFASSLATSAAQGYEVCVDKSGKMRLLDDTLQSKPQDHDDDKDDDDKKGERDKKNECKSKELLIEVASVGQFEDLQDAIEILSSDQTDMLGLLATLSTRVDVNQANVEGNAGAVSELETRVAVLEVLLTPTPTPTPLPTATPTPTVVATPTPTFIPTPTPTVVPLTDYQAVLNLIGATGVILPLVSNTETNSFGPSFTTVGGQALEFTWSEPVSAFDTAPSFENGVPVVSFNGTDEEADSPDATYWTVDDNGGSGFSVGAWVWRTGSSFQVVLAKYPASGTGEWILRFRSNNIMSLELGDTSAAATTSRRQNSPGQTGVWTHYVFTYSGAGGGTASNGTRLYVNGVLEASSAVNNGVYVAMEDTGTGLSIGSLGPSSTTHMLDGKLAGSSLGPFFTHTELSASEVAGLYALGKTALGLP